MNLSDWAKKEIEISKQVNKDPYGMGVLNSALKAFLGLCEDEHSGMSIQFTNAILNRLVACKPLTPLTGEDDEWDTECVDKRGDCICYQNLRCSSVFKYVYANGDVKYNDIDRFICEDINHGHTFYSGSVVKAVMETGHFPEIIMPYTPPVKRIVIFTEDFLVDPKNGDFDTRGIFYAIDNTNSTPFRVEINLYQKEVDNTFVNIGVDEYLERKKIRVGADLNHSDLIDAQKVIDRLADPGKLSDGYHTFDELYFHRMMLFSIICNTYPEVAWKSWKHADGAMYDGMFIVGVSLPSGDYSYHYNKEFWDRFNVKVLKNAPEWDGHKPEDIDRLNDLIK